VNDLGKQAGLSQDQVDRILGKNMEELFNLPPIPATVKSPVNANLAGV